MDTPTRKSTLANEPEELYSLEHWRNPHSGEPWVYVTIRDNLKQAFYDNDELVATVHIRGQGENMIKPPLLVTLAPLLAWWDEPKNEWVPMSLLGRVQDLQNRVPTEFRGEFYNLTDNAHLDIDVNFRVPAGTMATFQCKEFRLVWAVVVRKKSLENKWLLFSSVVPQCTFTKANMYIPVIGNESRVQLERLPSNLIGATYSPVQIEAYLGSDVYSQGSVVKANIIIHHTNIQARPMVSSVEASLVQTMMFVIKGQCRLNRHVTFARDDWSTLDWPLIPTVDGQGQWCKRSILLVFDPSEKDLARGAVTCLPIKNTKYRFSPSLCFKSADGTMHVEVTYHMQLRFVNKSCNFGSQMVMKLPFSVEVQAEKFTEGEKPMTIPRTTLRRLSISVAPDPPRYENLEFESCVPFLPPSRIPMNNNSQAKPRAPVQRNGRRRALSEMLPTWASPTASIKCPASANSRSVSHSHSTPLQEAPPEFPKTTLTPAAVMGAGKPRRMSTSNLSLQPSSHNL